MNTYEYGKIMYLFITGMSEVQCVCVCVCVCIFRPAAVRPLRSLWGTGRAGLVGLSYVIDTGSGGSLRDYLQVSPHLPIAKSKQNHHPAFHRL